MSANLTVADITERRTQWLENAKALQQKAQELNRELLQIQDQLSQLNGAIQACDVILNGTEPVTESNPVTSTE